MIGLLKLLKKRGRFGPSKFLLFFILAPTVIVLVLLLSFFLFDDFNMMVLIAYNQQQAERDNVLNNGYDWSDWSTYPGSGGGTGVLGGTGLSNMYINKMSGGYYKEMLEILRDHSDWSSMNSNVSPLVKNGEAIYPMLQQTLGTMLSEGGAEIEDSNRYSPVTPLSRLSYDSSDGKHTLGLYNSAVVAEDGGDSLSVGYNGNLDLFYGGAYDKRTNLQFDANYAAIYPSGRYTDEALYWPSKMNGYGIASGTQRTKSDTDAAYFPDIVSIVLQRSWCALSNKSYFDVDAMTDTSVRTAMYLPYNYGEPAFAYSWGVGIPYSKDNKVFTRDGWSLKNTITFAENTSNSVNYFDTIVEESLTRLSDDWDVYVKGMWDGTTYNEWYINHSDYMGFGSMALLLNGCFVDPSNVSRINSYVSDGGFIRGATVAYRVWTGDVDATTSDVAEWFRTELPVRDIDESIYGDWRPSSGNTTLIHYLDEDNKIYRDDGSGPYAALRSYGDGLRGPWMTRVGGVMVYWKMLQVSGVECTFTEAYQDSLGTLVALTPDVTPGADTTENQISDEASAVAEQMARCMAAYSWPTKQQGLYNNGTALYQSVHNIVLPGDPYYMSCDRGVATAVRWSGADDSSFPPGSTRYQIHYLEGTPYDGHNYDGDLHWERIYWNGDTSQLRPGDILIYSTPVRGTRPPSGKSVGHIIMWCGKDIIAEFHGDAAKGAVICHASYDDRSPTCQGVTGYDDFFYFECYRLYNPSPNEVYTQAAPYP